MKTKLRLFFIPFILIESTLLIAYTFLNWALIIKLRLVHPREELVQFGLPVILSVTAFLIWIWPKLRLLKLETKKGNWNMFYLILGTIGMTVPVIVAQNYLVTATGKLTVLKSINDIKADSLTEFYTLDHHNIDKSAASIARTSDVSGKYNSDLNFHIYISCPLYEVEERRPRSNLFQSNNIDSSGNIVIMIDDKVSTKKDLTYLSPDSVDNVTVLKGEEARFLYGDSIKAAIVITTKKQQSSDGPPIIFMPPAPKAWICFKYHKRVSNHESNADKEYDFKNFYDETIQDFNDANIDAFNYLEIAPYNDNRDGYIKAIRERDPSVNVKHLVLLEPRMNDFADRNGNKFEWIFGAMAIGLTVWFLLLLFPKLKDREAVSLAEKAKKENRYEFLKYLVPGKMLYATPIIVDVNIFIFLLMVVSGAGFISFDAASLLNWGASYGPYVNSGQWWRLITSIFVHAGFYHLFVNMIALLFVGIFLEPKLGKVRYALCYMATGFLASLVSLWWHSTPVVSMGASGAIFGLYGIFLAFLLMKVFPAATSKSLFISTIVFVAFNLIAGLTGGTDNAAHIGGLLSGFALGLIMAGNEEKVTTEERQ